MQLSYSDIEALLFQQGLCLFGGVDQGEATLLLIGPDGPRFWQVFSDSPEGKDGQPDPVDRWSLRVIGRLAQQIGAEARFPFGGPPHHPFLQWAVASGEASPSPVGMLVHTRAGLWVSYRGALILPYPIALPAAGAAPCETCADQPCRSACPVGALAGGYDTAACHAWLDDSRSDCMARGCAARRSCPVGQRYGRLDAQSAHHMKSFHP